MILENMECNKEEARRAMDLAEKKLSENDYFGAKIFVNKAQNLYPNLDGLKQVLMMIHVYISASKNGKVESDWYGILGVDPLADDETVKKQYKKLALLLHPDKNKFHGAEEAFKLVLEAWSLLSDRAKRIAYDQKRKPKTGMKKPPPNPQKPDSTSGNRKKPKPEPADSSQKNVGMFGTMCNKCKTDCVLSLYFLNKIVFCLNCRQSFIATRKPSGEARSTNPASTNGNQNAGVNNSSGGGARSTNNAAAAGMQKPPNPNKPASSNHGNPSGADTSQKNVGMFWTMCDECNTQCPFIMDYRLNKVILCPNCGQCFVATQWSSFVRPVPNSCQQQEEERSAQNKARTKNNNKGASSGSWINISPSASKTPQESGKGQEATNNNTNGASSSADATGSNGGNIANQEQERWKRAFEELQETTILKKQRTDEK